VVAPSEGVFAAVRSVRADDPNRVEIALDETRRKVVTGRMDDPNIQRLLLAATHQDNPAVRVESVDLLKGRAGVGEVRDALLDALAHDSNAGVRQKALEGLKPLSGDPTVRRILEQALTLDDNPAVRIEAVDLLMAQRDDSMVGVLQGMVQTENNDYVRLKVEKALKDMNASIGTF
jgi:HEAT repeat protein